jgi:DNA-binding transcriptional MerR regulator
MLAIGEFAWLGQVTIETLRHYDRMGLLKPVFVDPFTGYRHYTLEQLPRLNRILALKDLGLPLQDIRRMLDEAVTAAEIRSILAIKQTELEAQIQASHKRLARVQARLNQIETEEKMSDYDVLLKTAKAQWIASVREKISTWDQDVVGPTISRLFDEVAQYLGKHKTAARGTGVALWHENQIIHEGIQEESPDVEIAFYIDRPVQANDRIHVRELPVREVAYTVHHGDYTQLTLAKQAVFAWIEQNAYRRAGPVQEIYLYHDPDHKPNEDSPHHITEIQFPVEKP